jgi:tetratricopeptide (TPR) repeat protein
MAQNEELLRQNPAVNRFLRFDGLNHCRLGELLARTGEPAMAEAEYAKAMTALQKLVDNDPGVAENRSALAFCRQSLGILQLQMGKPSSAEAECRMAVEIGQKLADDNPALVAFRDRLANCVSALGDVVRARGRVPEAKELYERAIATTEERSSLALAAELWRRGLARRDLADPAGAAGDVRRALAICEGLPMDLLHQLETAYCHAALASLAGKSGSGVSASEGEAAAAKAMELLRRAVANGYRNSNEIRIESALDPLRNRADFKKLMAELEKNAPGPQKKK